MTMRIVSAAKGGLLFACLFMLALFSALPGNGSDHRSSVTSEPFLVLTLLDDYTHNPVEGALVQIIRGEQIIVSGYSDA